MIQSFNSKALESSHRKGDGRKLPKEQLNRIRKLLLFLEAAKNPSQIPSLSLHPLKGNMEGFFAISVSGNYRLIFRFDGEDVFDVDYLDYH
jgi:toxin HigB-1